MATNSRLITEKCSARIRSAHTYVHTSVQHAVDRKAIRSGLSVVPFITLSGSLLRENSPARLPMESPHSIYDFFSLFFSILAYDLLISLVLSSYPFFLRSKQGFPRCRKSRNVFDPGQSQRACDDFKYFYARCSFGYF